MRRQGMYLRSYFDPSREVYMPLLRRELRDDENVRRSVKAIIDDVRLRGDEALREYEERFDSARLDDFYVTQAEFTEAEEAVSDELKQAVALAYRNIEAFHKAQLPSGEHVKTMEGVECFRKIVPIDSVGLYIPGGTAPLFSTVLMLAIPAKCAGCRSVTLATPARNGRVNPAVLYAASVCGVDRVVKLGGAQAIAALAYGTQSVGRVDKIFGPGNRYVSFAKELVSSVCSIDMIAGPSEVMVVADRTSEPAYIASDLLSQAEHGADSQVILLIRADSEAEAEEIYLRTEEALAREMSVLGRHEYMLASLSHSSALAFYDDSKLIEVINEYAPEHLIISTANADEILSGVTNAGSVFLGPYSPESAGDYASGTNHTLPTSGWARSCSGVSVDSFIKKITVQRLSAQGLKALGKAVVTMAEAENLMAHAYAVRVRS